jgi:uncharacterized protein YceK
MERRLATLLLTVPLLLTLGCASIAVRGSRPDPGYPYPRYVYPGVQGDVEALYFPWDKDQPWCMGGLEVLLWVDLVPLFLMDLPCSFVVDTLCLPYDIYMVTVGGKTRTGEDRNARQPPAPAGGGQPRGSGSPASGG